MTTFYDEYLKSPEWQVRRQMKLAQAEYRCQVCNADGPILDVHHRTYDRLGKEHPNDLTVLCRECHEKYHCKTLIKASDLFLWLCCNVDPPNDEEMHNKGVFQQRVMNDLVAMVEKEQAAKRRANGEGR